MKKLCKFILIVVIYSFIFIIANIGLPFSDSFKQLNSAGNPPVSLLLLLLNNLWICFTVYFIITRSQVRGIKLTAYVTGVIFFVQSFMMQIETLFFGYAFEALTKIDILLIMVVGYVLNLLPQFAEIKRNNINEVNYGLNKFEMPILWK